MREKTTVPLPPQLRKRLASIVDDLGQRRARERLGLRRSALERALAGLPLQEGTRLLIGVALDAYARAS